VTALRREPPGSLAAAAGGGGEPATREVWFDADGPVGCPILRRGDLTPGAELEGPAIVEEPDSTTLVFAGDILRVDPSGVLVLTIGGGR
jgi:N-methylhydantoinase A/oxoprolinase/acetone carboxylase beta subunit